jgi:hypothetical protein
VPLFFIFLLALIALTLLDQLLGCGCICAELLDNVLQGMVEVVVLLAHTGLFRVGREDSVRVLLA